MDCFAELVIGRAFARPVGSQRRFQAVDSRISPLLTAPQAGKPAPKIREDAMTPTQDGDYRNRAAARLSRAVSILIASAMLIGASALPRIAQAGEVPTFAVDAA